MTDQTPDTKTLTKRFNKVVSAARGAIFVERAVPKIAASLCVGGLFLTTSWLGLWAGLPPIGRMAGVLAFAGAAMVAPILTRSGSLRVTKRDAVRRIDALIGDPARPAQTLADKPDVHSTPAQKSLWERHLANTAEKWGAKIHAGRPRIDLNAYDPLRLRYVIAAAVLASGIIAGDQRENRLRDAFAWSKTDITSTQAAALDYRAWISPPAGIDAAPKFLPKTGGSKDAQGADLTTHKNSVLTFIIHDSEAKITVDGAPVPLKRVTTPRSATQIRKNYEYSVTLGEGDHTIRIEGGAKWSVTVTPDSAPTAQINTIKPNADVTGTLEMKCDAKDDYGIVEGSVVMTVPGAKPGSKPLPSGTIAPVPLPAPQPCIVAP